MYVILIKEIQEWRVLLKYKPRGYVSTCQQINRHLKIPQFRNTIKRPVAYSQVMNFALRYPVLAYENLYFPMNPYKAKNT